MNDDYNLFDAALVLAKEIAFDHRRVVCEGRLCKICEALDYVWKHPKPVQVTSVEIRSSEDVY